MTAIRFVLLSDGSSDRALLPVLKWVLTQHPQVASIEGEWSDPRMLPPQRRQLHERIRHALEAYEECNLLFIHRDAEKDPPETRHAEIRAALEKAQVKHAAVGVVPVRMQEAWLLFDEMAVRRAAGNPNGSTGLSIPQLSELERLADPKECLHELLRTASGLRGRKLKTFDPHKAAHLVADRIEDFSPLRRLPAFRCLEQDVAQALRVLHEAEL